MPSSYRQQPPRDFQCPYQHCCPHLEGSSTQWVWEEYHRSYDAHLEHWKVRGIQQEEFEKACQYIIELEKQNLVLAEQHLAFAIEKSSMSGSLAFLLDSQFLKANLRIKQGFKEKGFNMIQKISREAKELEIKFLQDMTQRRLEQI